MCLVLFSLLFSLTSFAAESEQKTDKDNVVQATIMILNSSSNVYNKSVETVFFYQPEYAELANMMVMEWGGKLGQEFSVFQIDEDEETPKQVMDRVIHFAINFRRGTIVSLFDETLTKTWIKSLLKQDHRSLWLDHVMYTETQKNYYRYKQICSPEHTVYVIYNNISDETAEIRVNYTDGVYKAKVNSSDHRQKSCHYKQVELNETINGNFILTSAKSTRVFQHIYVGYAQNNSYFKLEKKEIPNVRRSKGDDDDDDDPTDDDQMLNVTEITGLEGRLIEMLSKPFVVNTTHYESGGGQLTTKICNSSRCNPLPESFGPCRSLIDMLLNQDIDIAISRIPLTEDLILMMDHSPVYYIDRFVLLSQSRTFSDSVNLIFRPIHPHVWYLISSSMFGIAPLYVFLERCVRREKERLSLFGFIRQTAGALFYIYRIFMGRVKAENRTNVSLRLFCFVWAVTGLIFGLYYNSMFTAAISSNSIEANVDTLAQLKQKLDNKNIVLVLKSMEDVIIGPIKDEIDHSIYSDIFTTASRNNLLQVIENDRILDFMVANPNAVLVVDRSSSYNLAVELRTITEKNYHISNDEFGWEMYAIIRRRGFPNKWKWDKYLWKILVSGTLNYWYEQDTLLFKTRYKFETEKRNENVPLLFTHFTSLWYIYATGMTAAITCLIAEFAIFKQKFRQQKLSSVGRPQITHRKIIQPLFFKN